MGVRGTIIITSKQNIAILVFTQNASSTGMYIEIQYFIHFDVEVTEINSTYTFHFFFYW